MPHPKSARVIPKPISAGARAITILSDAWILMVIRECFFGVRQFEQFQSMIGVPRATLAKRLKKLTQLGILARTPHSLYANREEYRLTEMGRELYPSMVALLAFGDKWLNQNVKPPLQLIHKRCGKPCIPKVVCSHCSIELRLEDVSYRDGPGAGFEPPGPKRRFTRRPSDPAILERGRPCSIGRALQIIGDRWTYLVVRQSFFGVRRFSEFQAKTGIAANILADRLRHLTHRNIFKIRKLSDDNQRFEYLLTEKGRDLYGPMVCLLRWGNKWLCDGKAPLILHHRHCDEDFLPVAVCDKCAGELNPDEMDYRLRYTLGPQFALSA